MDVINYTAFYLVFFVFIHSVQNVQYSQMSHKLNVNKKVNAYADLDGTTKFTDPKYTHTYILAHACI
jgi:hypothetical protein